MSKATKILVAMTWAGICLSELPSSAHAQQTPPVKVGFITTLSGPTGYLGADLRDGFQLAVDLEGGKLGGVPVQVIVQDDGQKPGQIKQIAERMLKTDKIELFTGILSSNLLAAAVPDILDAGGIYVSPNAAPSNFAGKECHKNYFVLSWQNDNLHESAGQNAANLGYKRAFILASNYQAGKDALNGFKRYFKGEIVGEIYTRMDQTDFAPEMAQIRTAKPDVVFHFHPGGLGIAFARQFKQAGLLTTVPLVVPASSLDATIVKALGEDALGTKATTHWNSDFDNAANKRFMDAWQKKYGSDRIPTYYASQAYDTALAIASALRATKGDLADKEKFRAAMLKADFESVRGRFKFNTNQHPIQDWYSTSVDKSGDGALSIKTGKNVFENHGDAYAKECKL